MAKKRLTQTFDEVQEILNRALVKPDWNEGDPGSDAYVRNRTHWTDSASLSSARLSWLGNTVTRDMVFTLSGTASGGGTVYNYLPNTVWDEGAILPNGEWSAVIAGHVWTVMVSFRSLTVMMDETSVYEDSSWRSAGGTISRTSPLSLGIDIPSETVHKLDIKFIDTDTVPAAGSPKPVTSGGVHTAVAAKYTKPASGIPASDLAEGVIPDVSGFVTKSVNDLVNYYLKSETYTKSEVQELIAAVRQFTFEVVDELPTASASTMYKIYLVPSAEPQSGNVRDEYITVESSGSYSWEQIGSTAIDLSGYATEAYVDEEVSDAVSGKQDTLVSGTNIKTVNGNSLLGSGGITLDGSNIDYTGADGDAVIIHGDSLDDNLKALDDKAYYLDINKQGKINDLDTIRAGAASGATAYQKPSGGIPAGDLAEGVIPTQAQADWEEDDPAADDYIKNKPNLSDYNPRIYVGTCSTAAATAAKVVTVEEFPLDSNVMPLVGTTIAVKFASTNSAANPTLDVNGIGNEQIWYGSAAYTSASNIAGNAGRYTFYMWDGTYWVWLSHSMDNDTNTLAYQVRYNNGTRNMTDYLGRYRLLFSSADGSKFVPSTTSTATDATTKRDVCQTPIDPFGLIVYYSSTSAVNAGSAPGATVLYTQQNVPLGYAFNRTGAALTLTNKLPVYVKCRPLGDGSAVIDPDEPYVQALPNTEDGKIYIYLGNAHSATNIELSITHPVYHYSDGAIRQWTNQSGATQLEPDVEYTKRAVIPFAKRARIEAVKGRSLAWNQLDNYKYYSDLVNSLNTYFDTVTVKSDGTYHVSGTLTAAKSWNLLTPINFIAGHKYAIIAKPVAGVNYKIENNSAGATSGKKWIGTQNTSGSYRVGIYILAGTYDTDFDRPLIFDLTLIFGSGYEPETVAEFEALYPLSYYGYDSGSLISNAATGIKVGGKNLLKMTGRTEYGGTGSPTAKFELDDTMVIKGFAGNGYIGAVTIASYTISEGKISVTTSSSSNSASYGIGIPFKVNPGWTYRIGFDRDSASATGVGLTWIDQAGYIISSETWYAINSKTAPSNAALAILDFKPGAISTTAVWENIMLTVNTPSTYEPYVSPHTVSLPITTMTGKLNGEGESVTIFPEGMRSAGTAYDSLIVDEDGWCRKAMRRFEKIEDLGDRNWEVETNTVTGFACTIAGKAIGAFNVLTWRYPTGTTGHGWGPNMVNKTIVGQSSSTKIYVRDDSYSDAASFKTAMSGVPLIYELATPLEYVLDTPLDITYATGYTEERLPEDTASSVLAPLRVDVRYGTSTGEILGMIGDVETLLAAL